MPAAGKRGQHRRRRGRPGAGGDSTPREDADLPAAHLAVPRPRGGGRVAVPRLAAAFTAGGLRGRRARRGRGDHPGSRQRERVRRPAPPRHGVLRHGLHRRHSRGREGKPGQAHRDALARRALPGDVRAPAGVAHRGWMGHRMADRSLRHRGHAGEPARRRARHHPHDVHVLHAAEGYHPAEGAAALDVGQRAGLLLACRRRGAARRQLRVPRRARQPDLGLAGLRAAVRGEHPVRAAVRAAVAAVVDQPQASSARRRPAARRRDHAGVQRGRQHRQAAALHRRRGRPVRRASARPGIQ